MSLTRKQKVQRARKSYFTYLRIPFEQVVHKRVKDDLEAITNAETPESMAVIRANEYKETRMKLVKAVAEMRRSYHTQCLEEWGFKTNKAGCKEEEMISETPLLN